MSENQGPVLRLENVARAYKEGRRDLVVLDGADFELKPGELVSLVAPSGAGKSTLLHLAGLLEKPDGGEVHVCGFATRDLSDSSRTALRRNEIGFVYQFHHLLPEFSAIENVVIPQLIAGTPKKAATDRARELLVRMGLEPRIEHRPSELSGGEQQRVALARAAAPRPAIILADEPTGNLDSSTGAAIIDLLFGLRDRHAATLVLVTHDPSLAQRCDRVISLRDGRVEAAA